MKFDYGDEVLKTSSELSAPGAVVEITEINYADQAERYGVPCGTFLYTIEYGDGTDELVPETELELLQAEA